MSRCESITLCCVLLSYLNVCPFFPYIGKVFTLPSDLSLIYVEDTILIDFVAVLKSGHLPAFFEMKFSLRLVLPTTCFDLKSVRTTRLTV